VNDLNAFVRKLLNEIWVWSCSWSPALDLGQSCLGEPFSLLVLALDSLDDGIGPWLHCCWIVIHEFWVLDIPLNIITYSYDGQFYWDGAWYLHRGMTDMRYKLFESLPDLGIFALERQMYLAEKTTQYIELVLNISSH